MLLKEFTVIVNNKIIKKATAFFIKQSLKVLFTKVSKYKTEINIIKVFKISMKKTKCSNTLKRYI